MTAAGQSMMHENHNLVIESTREIDVEGAEILGQYAVLGKYDFMMMVEASDNDAVARLSLEIGVKCGLHIESLPAIAIGFLNDSLPGGPDWRVTSVESPTED